MSRQPEDPTGDPLRMEALRLLCGDEELSSDELRAKLHADAAFRDDFEATRELLDELRGALTPAPLDPRVEMTIRARMNAAVTPRQSPWIWSLRVAGVAAAAGLMVALLVQTPTTMTSIKTGTQIALSPADAEALVSAYVASQWEGPTDYLVDSLADRVDEVAERLERTSSSETFLPWQPDDDWDLPPDAAEAQAATSPTRDQRWFGGGVRMINGATS